MKLVTYIENGADKPGFLSENGKTVYPFKGYASLTDVIAASDGVSPLALAGSLSGGMPADSVVLTAPIPHPKHDIWCIGQNYLAHAIESFRFKGLEYTKPDHPVYFTKRVDRAVANGGIIPAHADITTQLDYETELAVIIGKRCSHATRENAFDFVFGYTIVNDISARDLQYAHSQYAFGKSLDGFAPMGPWIVTADEFNAPPALRISTRINGELRQDSNTSDFIFDIPHLISEISAGIVLEAGDIIITGTPSGVGMGFTPPKFLKSGDIVECEIEGIGILKNQVK
jgi:2-keto-4-pentenoate hydratase/2-oxohepta-3-ene-1,7-dioic acid hydratase in catechol pathway